MVFDDSAANDFHLYQAAGGLILGGAAWQPDGRSAPPNSVLDTSARTSLLNGFNGMNPNGSWTLFVADLSVGGQSTVTAWGLDITAVPEPGQSLGVGMLLGSALLIRMRPRRSGASGGMAGAVDR